MVPSRVIASRRCSTESRFFRSAGEAALLLQRELRDQVLFEERFVRLRGRGPPACDCDSMLATFGFLAEERALQLRLAVGERRLRRLDRRARASLTACSSCGLRQLEDDRVGRDLRAGAEDDALDASLRLRVDPADVFGHERARAADLAQHRALLHRVDPDDGAIDGGRGGLQLRDAERDAGHHDDRDA